MKKNNLVVGLATVLALSGANLMADHNKGKSSHENKHEKHSKYKNGYDKKVDKKVKRKSGIHMVMNMFKSENYQMIDSYLGENPDFELVDQDTVTVEGYDFVVNTLTHKHNGKKGNSHKYSFMSWCPEDFKEGLKDYKNSDKFSKHSKGKHNGKKMEKWKNTWCCLCFNQ